ncbi:anti-sigma 24 factor [Thauera propionica]|uniref:Anti-sigma 24 factor n=1 Tax=Thauera propionica TaxID=2019431 RepID=A0A235EZ23_9RHOO|nr:sigma-E factor negative regulatory protein [Thauera propionica]OYD54240.1 anti-sigma 24 factor [Thauera propionica]
MKDKLSALIDGDLDEQAMRPIFEGLRRDEALRRDWDAYCLIGDVIRGERTGSVSFVDRVMSGLEDEPTVFAPVALASSAARSGLWHKLMPIAASVMGVAAVGLVAATLYSQDDPVPATIAVQRVAAPPIVANSAQSAVVVSRVQALVDDPLREYVFAHQGVSGGPMPTAVQYVRTVSAQPEGTGR